MCCAPLQVALERFRRWSKPPRSKPKDSKRPLQQLLDKKLLPDFKNGRKLRDYQVGTGHTSLVSLWSMAIKPAARQLHSMLP
jgi:hypothetical protein